MNRFYSRLQFGERPVINRPDRRGYQILQREDKLKQYHYNRLWYVNEAKTYRQLWRMA